jgi:hypothetical protein
MESYDKDYKCSLCEFTTDSYYEIVSHLYFKHSLSKSLILSKPEFKGANMWLDFLDRRSFGREN